MSALVPSKVKGKIPAMCAFVVRKFPRIVQVWGYHVTADHNTGECVDYMCTAKGRGPAEVKELGDAISAWFIAMHNAGHLKIKFMVWRGRAWRPAANSNGPKGWGEYKYPATHFDHVHVQVDPNIWTPPNYLPAHYVDPGKVSTYLYGLRWSNKQPEKQRQPGFRISTGIDIVTWNGRKWLITEAGYGYALDYLTTTKPQ